MTDLNSMTNNELVAYYNQLTGSSITKFASKAKAIERIRRFEVITAEATEASPQDEAAPSSPQDEAPNYDVTCPLCGTTEQNSITPDGEDGTAEAERFNFCHECGRSYDRKTGVERIVNDGPAAPALTDGELKRPAQATSMAIRDRRIVDLDTGVEYKNACRVWKAGLVSSSQGDKLSKELLEAAKAGERPVVTVNGHRFQMVIL